MPHPDYRPALYGTIITQVLFGIPAIIAFVQAWRRRRDKGHSQILGRQAILLIGLWLLLAPLVFLSSIWINIPNTPFYVHNRHLAGIATQTLHWTALGLVILAAGGVVLVIRKIIVEDNERRSMQEARQPTDRHEN